MLDLRKPSGWFFLLLGVILIAYGLYVPGLRAPLTSINLNLYAGCSMLGFGGVLVWLAHWKR